LRTLVGGCDLLVIPTTPDGLSLHALMQTVSALDALGADRYRVLLTIVPPRPNRDGDEAREMLKARKLPMFKGEIRRRIAFQKAVIAGVPVYDVDDPRAGEAWADYERIGKEIMR
jgi:chromosome partitioning protein